MAWAAPVHEVVASFDIPPQMPGYGALVAGGDGFHWGTTQGGGAYGNGTIYKVRTDGTDWQTVLSFSGNSTTNKGAVPYGGLVSDGAGNLWGTTNQGGAGNNGTIFKCDIATGALTTVAEFTNTAGPCKGANPWATLTSDGAGNLWGTTQKGGAASLGTIFKVNVATNAVTTMVEFADLAPTKGSLPCGRLIGDGAGSFWGTTYSGGANNYGTIFKINAATGALTTLVEFTSNDVVNRGAFPYAGLTSDGLGNLWGTTNLGGANNYGTVFKINAATGVLTTVIEFARNVGTVNRGSQPTADLVNDGAGYLWGTTSNGTGSGFNDFGTIFKVKADTGVLTTVLSFTYGTGLNKGAYPTAALLSDGAGSFWSTTPFGGSGRGTVFKVNASTGVLTTLVTFLSNATSNKGSAPYCNTVIDASGTLWGTTISGGANTFGTIFKINTSNGTLTTPVEFSGNGANNKGWYPCAGLISDEAGKYWGTTQGGGTGSSGTIFKVNATTGVLETVINFTGNGASNKGSYPQAGLVSDGAGNL